MWNRMGTSSFTTFINTVQAEQLGRRNKKNNKIKNAKVKLYMVSDNKMLFTENSKHTTNMFLELINQSSKIAGCKISIQKKNTTACSLIYNCFQMCSDNTV